MYRAGALTRGVGGAEGGVEESVPQPSLPAKLELETILACLSLSACQSDDDEADDDEDEDEEGVDED